MQGFLVNLFYHVVPFLFVLGLIVFCHELGHFLAAKRSGMKVFEFALGFGPTVLSREGNGTVYSIRAIPLGGFVRIAGMEPEEDPNVPGSFNSKPFGARFITLAAGCIMNFVLATVIYIVVGMAVGVATGVSSRIDNVSAGERAERAGVRAGDTIVGVGSLRTTDVATIRRLIEGAPGRPIDLTVERQSRLIRVRVTPRGVPADTLEGHNGSKTIGMVGIVFTPIKQRVGPWRAIVSGVSAAYDNTKLMLEGLVKLVTGRTSAGGLGGPVAVMRLTGEVAQQGGFVSILLLAAMLSLNIGLLNLLPIPALDGSRLFFLLWEKVAGRRLNPAKEAYVHYVGLVVLLLLMLVVTFHDISSWVTSQVPH